ncbi:hypothetical protein EJB05_20323 [Eragrostis curvula]|uniref:Uncharacterized protein n=1 Tax=Eragrostis curvula TaxID=38414 RepID=A0A5J9V0G3_9POAL|nr:hypothetical protein EJB05_20323 [Eragrostis curvula]
MSSTRASKAAKSTINYHRISLGDSQLFGPDALLTKVHDASHQSRQSPQSGSTNADRILTTPQFVSALTGIWSLIGDPESSCTTQRSNSHGASSREDPVCFSRDQQGHILTPFCAASSSGLISQNCSSTPKTIYEDLSSVKKMLMLTSFSSVVGASPTWRPMYSINKVGVAQFLQFGNTYSMQTERTEFGTSGSSERSLSTETFASSTNMSVRNDNYSSQSRSVPAELCTIANEEAGDAHDCESSVHDTKSSLEIFQADTKMSACSIQQVETVKEARIMAGNQISSKACTEVHLDDLTCTSCLVDNSVVDATNADQYAYGDDMNKQQSVDRRSTELQATFWHRFDGPVTMNRHAVAGALAGTAVSVSLHPVDTVKTLIQANSSSQSSFYHTLRHILVERGILGLYGGLASKLICSAPISAIYTFTYEIVKGNLLPVLPKEYHSIAHCTAGGCSSLATSFVFTPSECIKQQMQVGSQYQNCWKALVGCLQRGGIASLYAGWGAVLCRNIPHSIVKFYAYESLKQLLLESAPANAKLDSGQTALSPASKYEGVLHALREIFQQEGIRGLYRGLTPRLAIYISQGAIFFTSYEFLKTIMFSEQELPAKSF